MRRGARQGCPVGRKVLGERHAPHRAGHPVAGRLPASSLVSDGVWYGQSALEDSKLVGVFW